MKKRETVVRSWRHTSHAGCDSLALAPDLALAGYDAANEDTWQLCTRAMPREGCCRESVNPTPFCQSSLSVVSYVAQVHVTQGKKTHTSVITEKLTK